jgi:imidazolonepropionase-like amidohydrolase
MRVTKRRFVRCCIALLFLAFVLCNLSGGERTSRKQTLLILSHVTVIDGTGAPAERDRTVIISGDRIAEIRESSNTHTPRDGQLFDASGKFLIPGLWDMHVHWGQTGYLPLFLANGVTGMRIMWGFPSHYEWRRRSARGDFLAPHLSIASTIIDGPKPFWPGSLSVSTEMQARQAVIQTKRRGADFVKVYTFLTREQYFAIMDESKKQGISVAGHVPKSVSVEEASQAGQRSVEHLTGILSACTTRSDEFLKAGQADLVDDLAGPHPTFWGNRYKALRQTELDAYNAEKASALFAVLKRNGTWQVPTLTLLRSLAYVDDISFTNDPRLKYMPPELRRSWRPENAVNDYGPRSPEDLAFAKKEFQKDLEVVGAMQKAGVGILAGTDTSNPFCMPGFSLHDELGLLVKAGLTPIEALQTATLNPATFLDQQKDFGTIEKGKVADLVLLDANPLDNIANTTKISSVIYGGKVFPRAALDKMLANVEALASLVDVMMKTINEKDVAAAIKKYRELKTSSPSAYEFTEDDLIDLGYRLIGTKKLSDAIEVFKLSVEEYPLSYNTWDSLAEAYMDHGDKDLAISDYKKSLQLNPENTNATEKLKSLAAQ